MEIYVPRAVTTSCFMSHFCSRNMNMEEEYNKPTKKCFAVFDILLSLNRVSQCNHNITINWYPNFAFLKEKSQATGLGKLYVI